MPLTHQDYQKLVRRLEQLAELEPARFRSVVRRATRVGQVAYFLFVAQLVVALLLALALTPVPSLSVGCWVLLYALSAALKAMILARRDELPEPEGIFLSRHGTPAIHAEVEAIGRRLGLTEPVEVYLNHRDQASAMRASRRPSGGRRGPCILLGLPLLDGLSVDQARALVAHELGHLAQPDDATALGVIRRRWERAAELMRSCRVLPSDLLEPFLRRYRPWHDAVYFVALRRSELWADAGSAAITTPHLSAGALLRIAVIQAELSPVINSHVRRLAAELPEPPEDLSSYAARLAEGLPEGDRDRFLWRAMTTWPGDRDTHPTYGDRLARLGVAVDEALFAAAGQAVEPASRDWLGEARASLAFQLTAEWRERVRADWAESHEQLCRTAARAAALDSIGAQRQLTCDELWELADLALQRHGREAALPRCEEILDRDPTHYAALNLKCELLAIEGDARAPEVIPRLMDHGPRGTMQACGLLAWFYRGGGRRDAAEAYASYYHTTRGEVEAGEAERRAKPVAFEAIEPHGLTEAALDPLVARLRDDPAIARAWLVRRVTSHLPDEPSVFLLVKPAHQGTLADRTALVQRLLADLRWPPRTWHYVALPGHCSHRFDRRVRAVPGSRIL